MKVIGMLPVLNDEDIIEEVIKHLVSQEIDIVVLDNGSTDSSYKICEKFLDHGILELRKFQTPTFIYHSGLIFRMLYDMAISNSPDWVLLNASDEILESKTTDITLKKSIEKIDSEGYNLIQFDRFDFYLTNNDNESAKSIKDRLRYYSCYGDYTYRAWKYFPGINIGAGGHLPIYPEGYNYKISPHKFVLRHYPFRKKQQVEKKLQDRTRGTNYLKMNSKIQSVKTYNLKNKIPDRIDHEILTKYLEDGKWNYELKYCPLLTSNPPTMQEIFTNDGFLINREPTIDELKLRLREETEKHYFSYVIYKIKSILESRKNRR